MNKRTIPVFCILVALVLSTHVFAGDAVAVGATGVSYRHIGDYGIDRLDKILGAELAGFSTFQVKYPQAKNAVSLYRVSYDTVIPEKNNRPARGSGLLAVPKGATGRLPVVSYQHGTVFSKTEVPSNPEQSDETRIMVARFAGQGYIVIAADYIGKGESGEPDSYMVRESTAQACLDMLLSSRPVLKNLGLEQGDLFLSGWSQGAWSTMVFRNRLEGIGVAVKAAATASTPSDLYMLVTRWINKPTSLDVSWIVGTATLLIGSYERYYGLPGLGSAAIKEKYRQTAADFYSNKIGWEQASKVFPATVSEFFEPEFAAASSLVANSFYTQLQENQGYRWRFKTPTRYYYGKADEVITPYIATLPAEYETTIGGAPAEAVYAGDTATHRGTFLYGVLDQKDWFEKVAGKQQEAISGK